MTPPAGAWRNRLVNAALGVDLQNLLLGFQQSLARSESGDQLQATAITSLDSRCRDLEIKLAESQAALDRLLARSSVDRDDIGGARKRLEALRSTQGYERAMADPEPLVTVRIASYQRTDELMDVAIASVLAQTYARLEIIVVNDGPNEKTRSAVTGLGDPRIQYHEFSRRNVYPADAHSRWMVAGSPGMNRGAALAAGTWLAPLDDDDAFTADHVEKLLRLAQTSEVELAYGALVQRNMINETDARIWSFPPAISQFSFQSSIYLQALSNVFEYDEASWVVPEPGDWNLIRRMTAAGVLMAATEDVVGTMFQIPYTHKAES
jgi:hypothetical protein